MLNRARYADGDVEVGVHGFSRLTNLHGVRNGVPRINGGSRSTDRSADGVCDGLKLRKIVGRAHASTSGNDDVCLADVKTF